MKLLCGFTQSSDTAPGSDNSSDPTKLAELESRLAAQSSETERLKVNKKILKITSPTFTCSFIIICI